MKDRITIDKYRIIIDKYRIIQVTVLSVLMLISKVGNIHSETGSIGTIGNIDRSSGEVVININSGTMVEMGDLIFVRLSNGVAVLRVTFPMQTTAKCKLLPQHKKLINRIGKGTDVYRYYRGVEKGGDEAAVIPGKASGEIKRIGNLKFVYIPGGTFFMGSPQGEGYEDEHPQHKVTLDGFWIGKFEVTQKQFKEIMGYNPSSFSGKPDNPVEQVSWLEARDFCDKFSDKYGVTARLPLEAEWEYAARGGAQTKYYWGDDADFKIINKYSVYEKNSLDKGEKDTGYGTQKVGSKAPNGFGLYDMSGNVSEFCRDWYDDWDGKNYYSKSVGKNPYGALSGTMRVIRGGSWCNRAEFLRSASRSYSAPANSTEQDGFRVVIVPVR